MEPPEKQIAQYKRATALANYLQVARIGSMDARFLTTEQWNALATAIPMSDPSDETRRLAISLLADRENVRLRFRTEGKARRKYGIAVIGNGLYARTRLRRAK